MTVNLLDFDLDGLTAFCEQLGEKRFRATQLFRWIHQRGAQDFDQMSDLAKSLRDKLKGCAQVRATRLKQCSFPRTTEERSVCLRRPDARWDAVSAPRVIKVSAAT